MPNNKPYVLWLYSKQVQLYKLDNDKPNYRLLWNNLPSSEKKIWKHRAKFNSDWIKENCLKRCNTNHKWMDSMLVAKSKLDDIWYIVDDTYRQSTQIQGSWPIINGKESKSKEINIQVKWTDDGLRLYFSRI